MPNGAEDFFCLEHTLTFGKSPATDNDCRSKDDILMIFAVDVLQIVKPTASISLWSVQLFYRYILLVRV